MATYHRKEFEVACNWKPFVEVFNEYYHLKAVHPRSIGGFFQMPDPPDAVTGNYVTQFGRTEETSAFLADARDKFLPPIAGLDERHLHGTRYTLVYPNLTFGLSRDMMWMYEVFPISPGRTRIGMTLCFPASSGDLADFADRAAAYRFRHETAIAEDVAVLERQQRGFSADLPTGGRYSDLEPNVAAFGRWVVERVLARQHG